MIVVFAASLEYLTRHDGLASVQLTISVYKILGAGFR
jgi:hypothetical protein